MNYSGPFDANALGHSAASLNGDGFSFGLKPAFIQHHSSDAHVVVPDAHLLFSGNYTRIGSDLIIADADHKLVVGGYFKGDTRPTLMSSDGAALSGQIVEALTGHVHYAQAASPAPAAQVIGHVLKMSGSASAIRNGVSIELHIGDAVQKGDVIQTGSDSSIGMTFIDGSAFGMTSNARMVLNEMIYDPNGSSNSSLMSLVQGTITFVAGQTAKNGNMRVDTPVATMGIRGTAVLVEIGADNGPTKFSVLVEPDGHTGSYNLYDKSTGQLIGTVSQAGQVTFVSIGGIGQPPSAVEQLKTMQDQQQEKALIQQVFQLYFPNYNPDNSNPKTQKFGSTSYNNLAEITFTTNNFNNQTFLTQIELRIAVTDPHTGVTTYQNRLFFNTKAIFSADSVFGDQAFTPTIQTFKFQDVVHINDPDIGNAPFYDIGVPFVAGSAVIKSAESSISNVSEAFLKSLIHIDQTTGQVTFDRQQLNFLDDGQTVTIKIQVTATSGPDTGHVIVPITITGANDAPTIVLGDPQHPSVIAGAVTEDTPANASSLAADGVISFQDVDLTDAHTASVALTSTASTLPGFVANTTKIGTFTIDPVSENLTDADNHGSVGWHFTLDDNDPTLQSLAKGQTITQTYTITITDDNGVPVTQTVTITITGTNDAPVLTADVAAGNPVLHYTDERQDRTGDTIADTACGTLSFTDVDLTDTHVASAALDADTTTSIVWSGHSASSLPAGLRAALQNAVSVSVIDSTNTGAGTVHWDFSASDELFDFLGKNETLTLTYNVTVADYYHDAGGAHLAGTSSTQTITIVIGAANDQPVILATSTLADAITETETQTGDASSTAAHTATGIVKYADVDIVDVHSISQTGSTGTWTDTHGVSHNITDAAIIDPSHLVFGTVDQNGNTVGWSYTVADNALDFLAADEKLVVTYDVIVQDSSGADNGTSTTKQITITITGTNDVPVFTSEDVSGVINETSGTPVVNAAALTDSGIIKFTDVDLSDTHAVSATGTFVPVTPGDVALGTLTAVLDSDIDHTTGLGGQVTWTYSVDPAKVEYLAAGEHLIEQFTITIDDGTSTPITKTISVTITGTNDVPVFTSEDVSGVINETMGTPADSQSLTDSGIIKFTDVDLSDTHAVSATGTFVPVTPGDVALGTLTAVLDSDIDHTTGLGGQVTWTYSVDPAKVEYLAAGEHLIEQFTITIDDGTSAPITKTISVDIVGSNDVPVIGGIASGDVTEDTALSGNHIVIEGDLTITDADHDQSAFVAQASTVGDHGYGSFTLDASGHWTYTADNNQAAIQQLGADDTLTDSFTTHSMDGTADQLVTVTIHGTNDAPVMNVDNVMPVEDPSGNGVMTVSGVTVSDVDAGSDTFIVTAHADNGSIATIGGDSLDPADGGFTGSFDEVTALFTDGAVYTPNYSGLTATDKVTLTVTDGHSGSDTVNFIFKQYEPNGGVTLNGTTGKDWILSSTGDDLMTGNGGGDNFVFAAQSGNDTITDFHAGTDHIVLNGYGIPSAQADLTAWLADAGNVTETGGSAVIHLDANDTITLNGVTKASLTAHDFIIHPAGA